MVKNDIRHALLQVDIHKGLRNIFFVALGNVESAGDNESYEAALGNPMVIERTWTCYQQFQEK